MNRDEFMELVYETFETFADEPDNVLANGIIEAADAYVEHEKAQLSQKGTTKDAISRQAALDLVKDVCDAVMSGCESWYDPETGDEVYKDIREVDAILKCNKEVRIALRNMSPAQPEREEGEWIPVHPIQDDDPGAYMCSKCKTGMWEIRPSAYHYCPNCGEHMRGEKDG